MRAFDAWIAGAMGTSNGGEVEWWAAPNVKSAAMLQEEHEASERERAEAAALAAGKSKEEMLTARIAMMERKLAKGERKLKRMRKAGAR